MIEKGSMFKAWEATTEQQKKAHEMQAIYKAQETARQAIQEAMNRYIKKKTRARSVAKAEADPFAELEGWESLEQIQEAYGYGEITSDRRDKLTDLWEAREAAQRKGKKDGKYHDLVTDMLARAIHSVGIEYADEIAAYEEERRMRRSYYEKVENRANGLQEEEPDPLSPARAAIATAMQAAKVSEVTGAPLPKPLTWKRGFYDTTRTFPSERFRPAGMSAPCADAGRTGNRSNAPNATRGWNRKKRRGEPWEKETIRHLRPGRSTSTSASRTGRIRSQNRAMRASAFWTGPRLTSAA